ncbi:PIA2-like protein [Mya arenaria]|uniref:PIA2-like protein n=1 Tax=Mya arenaria TaxID=6604 RepID=A0ABY7F9K7_MYAAR|nr:PIA2-like protein [Mya arenaria]
MIKERKTFATQALYTEIDGWMPLHACVLHASKKLLKVFLSSGVDVNIPMGQPEGLPRGCTPLHIACWRGDIDITKFLLSHGADVDAADGSGRTPVMYAVKRRHRHIVRLLEDKGANMAAVQLPWHGAADYVLDAVWYEPEYTQSVRHPKVRNQLTEIVREQTTRVLVSHASSCALRNIALC